MRPRVFVSGAAGFVGRHLCAKLRAEGCTVAAVIRREDPYLSRIGVQTRIADLWDAEVLASALEGASVVIHCAGDPTFGNGPQYWRANVELTDHLLDAVKRLAPTQMRFVLVSTIGAVDRRPGDDCASPLDETTPEAPTSDYGRSKLEAESRVRQSGAPFVIVRPAMVVGDDMRFGSHFAVFARQALRRTILARIAWPGRMSVVHVDALADALWLAATHPSAEGRTFFCAGETMSIAECYALCDPRPRRLPLGRLAALMAPVLRWMPFRLKVMLLPALTATDASLRALGWQPRHPAAESLAGVVLRERARQDPEIDPGGQSVVTGAASGLGRAIAEYLAPRRRHLLLIDRDADGLAALGSLHPDCRTRIVDLSDEHELQALLSSPEWTQRPIAELFACAGFGARGRVQDIDAGLQRRMFAVNVQARLSLAHAAMPDMVRRQFGRIVFVSSSSAFQPLPFMATYAATNSALLSLGEAWSREVSEAGVHLMTVCPGGMQTEFQRRAGVRELPDERLMSPERVVAAIVRGLRRGRMTLVVSRRSQAMALLARILPRRAAIALWYRLMERMR